MAFTRAESVSGNGELCRCEKNRNGKYVVNLKSSESGYQTNLARNIKEVDTLDEVAELYATGKYAVNMTGVRSRSRSLRSHGVIFK